MWALGGWIHQRPCIPTDLHGVLEVPGLQDVLGDLLLLVGVELDQLAVVRFGQCKQGDWAAGGCLGVRDVTHPKEETHLSHHLSLAIAAHSQVQTCCCRWLGN